MSSQMNEENKRWSAKRKSALACTGQAAQDTFI